MIGITTSGDHNRTKRALERLLHGNLLSDLHVYGQMGVEALASATPVDTFLTRNSWRYRIVRDRNGPTIEWYNTNAAGDVSVAILIQYGHGTGNGGYVVGRDYINPAMRPIFDKIADEIWKKVKS